MNQETLDKILAARASRRAVALVTALETGEQRVVMRDLMSDDPLTAELTEGFRFDRSSVIKTEEGEFFVNIFNPPLKLIIIGAVHVAQRLIPIAKLADYDVTVIDPRGAFATPERFPDVDLRIEWPDEALPHVSFDQRTAFVALTHDPKIDDPALKAALASPCFYIGALGSKRTHAGRLERLSTADCDDQDLKRVHGPIGIDIGARGPAEIAISIMAEMTRALRMGS
jgi:xanthine dehydrogenase accessory factor